jgi:hypothetical protein
MQHRDLTSPNILNFDFIIGNDEFGLVEAIRLRNLENVKLAIAKGADVNENFGGIASPLIIACNIGHVEIVEYLLEKGADPNFKVLYNNNEVSPLSVSWYSKNYDLLEAIIRKGANLNLKLNHERRALTLLEIILRRRDENSKSQLETFKKKLEKTYQKIKVDLERLPRLVDGDSNITLQNNNQEFIEIEELCKSNPILSDLRQSLEEIYLIQSNQRLGIVGYSLATIHKTKDYCYTALALTASSVLIYSAYSGLVIHSAPYFPATFIGLGVNTPFASTIALTASVITPVALTALVGTAIITAAVGTLVYTYSNVVLPHGMMEGLRNVKSSFVDLVSNKEDRAIIKS